MFIGGEVEYTPYGKPYKSYEECYNDIDHKNTSIHVSYQCFDKDILITLLKNK